MPTVDPTPHPPSKYLVAYREHRRHTWTGFAVLLVLVLAGSVVAVFLAEHHVPAAVTIACLVAVFSVLVAAVGVACTLAFAFEQVGVIELVDQQRMQMEMERDLCERELARRGEVDV
jgi:hypothetical protein